MTQITNNERPLHRNARDLVNVTLASAFGLGLSPVAPGTCGALLGVLIHLAVVLFLPQHIQLPALIISLVLVCLVHFKLTDWAVDYWQDDDPRNFVLDEVVGYLTVPILFHHGHVWQIMLWGFILFRILDIIKIPPARQIDRYWHGPWGIVLDDIVSAGYAVLVMYLMKWLGPMVGLDAWLIST